MITDTIRDLTRHAETIRNTQPQSLATMEVGDEHRQGDLRLIRLPDDFAASHAKKLNKAVARPQLVPGSTQGSRHILRSLEGVTMWTLADATPLDGPIFQTPGGNAIDHPEHGAVTDLPAGCYATPGQRAYADTLRRVAD